MGSFSVHNSVFDWKRFIDNAIQTCNSQNIDNLILDIRENEGGQSMVGKYILERVINEPIKMQALEMSVRYLKIPERIKKHISTWDNFPYDFSNKYTHQKSGRYFLKSKYGVKAKTFRPKKNRFKGQVYLITDSSNSSATHLMAAYADNIPNITIVGQETGGNQQGTNGSFIFFLRLPNTKIVVDIPVIHQVVATANPPRDGGVIPDVIVKKTIEDLINGTDREIETITERIRTRTSQ